MKEMVIKIADEVYERLFTMKPMDIADQIAIDMAIRHGKLLPPGHGRLIDADAVLEEPIGNTYKDIDIAETIIEADKEDKKDE